MTLRNIGIVFSPTLGIPAGIFSELVSNFAAIFDDDPPPVSQETARQSEDNPTLQTLDEEAEETVRRKRNSMLYQAGGADVMLGLGGRSLDPGRLDWAYCSNRTLIIALEDSASDGETDENEGESESRSLPSDDYHSAIENTPRADGYTSAGLSRSTKPAAMAIERGILPIADTPSRTSSRGHGVEIGIPGSPLPGTMA